MKGDFPSRYLMFKMQSIKESVTIEDLYHNEILMNYRLMQYYIRADSNYEDVMSEYEANT